VSAIKDIFRRERRAHSEFMIGTSLKDPELVLYDAVAPVWTIDVDVGGRRILKDVPVKAVASGGRFYAGLGQTVLLKRNAQGRFDVVGSADRKAGVAVVKSYDIESQLVTATGSAGFAVVPQPFDFYMGDVRMRGNPAVTFNQIPAANDQIVRAAGSWATDGFLAGHVIRIGNTNLNDATRTILSVVSATVLEFSGDVLTDEGPISNVFIARNGFARWHDGATPFPKLSLIDQSTGLEV
jgi:hypothetical protein